MPLGKAKHLCIIFVIAGMTSAAFGAEMTPAAIDNAEPSGKTLPSDRPTPVGARLQVLLDRAHFSPGEIDGKFGENAKKALRAYSEAHQLPSSNVLTEEVWKTLRADDRPVTATWRLIRLVAG